MKPYKIFQRAIFSSLVATWDKVTGADEKTVFLQKKVTRKIKNAKI